MTRDKKIERLTEEASFHAQYEGRAYKPALIAPHNIALSVRGRTVNERHSFLLLLPFHGRRMSYIYKKTPQGDLALHLYLPEDWRSDDKRPAILFFFGGGWRGGFFNRYPWLERTIYLADRFLADYGYIEGKPAIELPEGEPGMKLVEESP